MAVRLRLKRLGRKHRPFFRICAMDARRQRDGKVIEELGFYDPMVPEADARAILKGERIKYWLGVGAQPTPKVGVLIKKYGSEGTHLEQQKAALERIRATRPTAPPPMPLPLPPRKPAARAAEPPADESMTGPSSAEAPLAESTAAEGQE